MDDPPGLFFFKIKFTILTIFNIFLKDFIYLFLERGEGKEKERERNLNVWLPLTWPPLGTWPTTQACANWESNQRSFGLQPVLNLLSYTSQVSFGSHKYGSKIKLKSYLPGGRIN